MVISSSRSLQACKNEGKGRLRRRRVRVTPLSQATLVYYDNISTVYMSSNPIQHQRTKHIEVDLHFVQERVALGAIRVLTISTMSQFANIFTKGCPLLSSRSLGTVPTYDDSTMRLRGHVRMYMCCACVYGRSTPGVASRPCIFG